MSWNFSQCFYYRPPVLNIFQSNTPKFHCLQWINNTVLSLKYRAFFNQALSVKQKLLERYFFMIRTIRNLAAIIKGCSSPQSHARIRTRVCVSESETPGVDSVFCLDWLTSVIAPDFRRLRPKTVWTPSTKEQNHASLFHVLRVLVPEFSAPYPSYSRLCSAPPVSVLLLRTRRKFVLVVGGVCSPLCWSVSELTRLTRLRPTWNSRWLLSIARKRIEQPDGFISSSQITILPTSPTLSLAC